MITLYASLSHYSISQITTRYNKSLYEAINIPISLIRRNLRIKNHHKIFYYTKKLSKPLKYLRSLFLIYNFIIVY